MELEKYIKAAKEAINSAYFDIQDALMKNEESQEKLKNKGWSYKETAYQQEYQKIVESFKQETATAVENCKRVIQEQKESYMKEVDEFYRSDGSKLDLNFMNLIKAEIPLTAKEITDVIEKNKENLTMLRVIHKYLLETNQHSPEHKRIVLDSQYMTLLRKAIRHGDTEEKIFDEFVHFAAMGLNHTDKSFTLYQAKLDDYEEDAHLELLKAKIFIDAETKEEIDQIEEEQRKKHNEKSKKLDCGLYHGAYTFS